MPPHLSMELKMKHLVFAFPLLLTACGTIQPWQPEFCKTTPYSCNQDESAAKSAPGGNPAPAAAKAPEPPKVEPEKPSKPEKPDRPGRPDRPDRPDRPGHGYGDNNHNHSGPRGPRDGNHNDREQSAHGETGKRSGDEK